MIYCSRNKKSFLALGYYIKKEKIRNKMCNVTLYNFYYNNTIKLIIINFIGSKLNTLALAHLKLNL